MANHDLSKIVDAAGEVFDLRDSSAEHAVYAEYGTTSYADVRNAYVAGKQIYIVINRDSYTRFVRPLMSVKATTDDSSTSYEFLFTIQVTSYGSSDMGKSWFWLWKLDPNGWSCWNGTQFVSNLNGAAAVDLNVPSLNEFIAAANGSFLTDIVYDASTNFISKVVGSNSTYVTSMQALMQNLPNRLGDVPQAVDGSQYLIAIRGNTVDAAWEKVSLGNVWPWIAWKIQQVLGLTAANYGGTAASATNYTQSGGIASALAAKSNLDHTHAVTLAGSNASPDITLSPNSKYALTVAGESVVIKTPPGPFFATYDSTDYGDFVQAYIAGCDIYVTYPYISGGVRYLNVHKPQIVASEYNDMYSFIMVFDIVNMSSGTTGTIMWQLSQSGWKCYHNGTWESGTQYMYSPVDFYAPNLATKSDLNSYATIASLSDYATKTELNAVSRYGGQHASCLVKVNGNWSNEISGAVYDARGNNVGTFSGVGSIPSIINRTSDVVEIFMKVTSTYSGTGTVGFNFQDVAVEKPIRIHIRNSSGQTFRIRLRKEGGETTTCTYYTATSADVGTYFNVDTPANSTSDWLIMVSGVESNACYCINRI